MAQLNDTDSLLVNRSGKSYQIEAQNLMAELLDDDLMLVNRSGKSYKASGAEIKDSLGPKGVPNKPSIISPADGAGVPISANTGEITSVSDDVAETTLGLATTDGLQGGEEGLEVGDDIIQDSGYQPITSTVTNVATTSGSGAAIPWETGVKTYDITEWIQKRGISEIKAMRMVQGAGNSLGYGIAFYYIKSNDKQYGGGTSNAAAKDTFQVTSQNGSPISLNYDWDSWARGSAGNAGYVQYASADADCTCQNLIIAGDTEVRIQQYTGSQNARLYITDQSGKEWGLYETTNYNVHTLTFTNDQDLENFRAGDVLVSGGVVESVDVAAKQMSVLGGVYSNGDVVRGPNLQPGEATVGAVVVSQNQIILTNNADYPKRWIANAGKYVKGKETPSKDAAPDAEGLTLISSAFASTPPGAIGQTGASWQVAAYDDINFSSPVAQKLDSTSDLGSWEVVPQLEDDTKYRCRVQHISSDQESEWSDASTFRTAKKADPNATSPGEVYLIGPNALTPATKATVPTLVQSTASRHNAFFAVGIDGHVYYCEGTESTFVKFNASVDGDNAAVFATYHSPATASAGFSGLLLKKNDGRLVAYDKNGVAVTVPSAVEYGASVHIRWIANTFLVLNEDRTRLFAADLAWHNGGAFNTSNVGKGAFAEVNPPEMPGGVQIRQILAGDYSQMVHVLGTDGVVYMWDNSDVAMTAANRSQRASNVKLMARPSYYQKGSYGNIGFLMNDGTIWGEVYSSPSPFGKTVATDLFQIDPDSGRKYRTPPFCPYQNSSYFMIGEDGKYYGSTDSIASNSITPIQGLPDGSVRNVGNFFLGQTSNSATKTLLIVPS